MLELQGLACVRANRLVFRGVNARVPAGSALHVAGPNGCGKTSLLRIVAGLMPAARGRVSWAGVSTDSSPSAAPLTWLGHLAGLKGDLTALENLLAAQALRGEPVTPAQANAALAQAGLAEQAHIPVRKLSQGQARRVALAALWLREPGQGLWLLDEPFNALDAAATERLAGVIGQHLQAGGVALFSSHQAVALGAPVQSLALASASASARR